MRTFVSTFALFILAFEVSRANPTGGNVAAGSAAIAGQGTSAVTVNQASNTAIINWQSFSINSGEMTKFVQPSATSAALNRVLGGQTSIINGTLSANGQIYLVNGNGILVGPNGVISAGAFTGSTRDITDADFLSGNLHFTGSSNAGVQNLGKIEALGGDVVLIGKTVDNQGTISAPKGTAGLIAADDILLAQKNSDGSTIKVSPTSMTSNASDKVGIHNSGSITAAAAELKAANGNIYALAVQNEGTIRATTVQKQGGHIWLTSDAGTVANSGTLDASATATSGKGGTITLKSKTGRASHTGKIIAQGGQGGTGGNAEVSGAQVQFSGTIDLTAQGGVIGNFLLDPTTMEIITGGGSSLTGSTVDPTAIVAALNGANVTLQADDSITVTNAINASGNGSAGNLVLNTLTLNLNAGIALKGASTLSGSATAVNVGASGLVQNGVDAVASSGVVNLSSNATYSLSGEVLINKSLTLNGNGATLDANYTSRVMEIDGSASGVDVTLNDLTLEHGLVDSANGGGLLIDASNSRKATVAVNDSSFVSNAVQAELVYDSVADEYVPVGGYGAGIYSNAQNYGDVTLSLNSTVLILNYAYGAGGGGGGGGGIANDAQYNGSATLTIRNSAIIGNFTQNSAGGAGIFNTADYSGTASLTIENTVISNNVIYNLGYGAGIYNIGEDSGLAPVTISNSTISSNTAQNGFGGGIFNIGSDGNAPMTITNTTIAYNTATRYAAIDNDGYMGSADLTISNSTIVGNYGTLSTGGILNDASTVTISNTILAGNTGGSSPVESDYRVVLGGTLNSLGYNIYGQNGTDGGFTGAGVASTDILLGGAISTVVDTSSTTTGALSLVAGSIAIDAGDPLSTLTTDQRGAARGGAGNGLNAGSRIDIGAYEATSSYLVTNTLDDNSVGSLRSAIVFGNNSADPNFNNNPANVVAALPYISFDSNVFATPQTITLTQGQIEIFGSMEIDGANKVTLDANHQSRVFEIVGTIAGVTFNLDNLTLTNGNGGGSDFSGSGGAIFTYSPTSTTTANVTINNSTLTDNSATGNGGAIYNYGFATDSVVMTIRNSTLDHNSSGAAGGAIANDGTTILTIDNSTFAYNTSVGNGGAIENTTDATLAVTHSTITANASTAGAFGGIGGSGAYTIGTSIVAGNNAPHLDSNLSDSGTSLGHNLFGVTSFDVAPSDILMTQSDAVVYARLFVIDVDGNPLLANNGGPTQTIALNSNSNNLAVGNGGTNTGYELDQRGYARVTAGEISIGAYEYDPLGNPFFVTTNVDPASGDLFGSLRTAFNYSNANPWVNPTITFDEDNLFATAQTITLAQGQLFINSSLTLQGPEAVVTLDAHHASRVMEIDGTADGTTVNLSNLTMINGNAVGANISGYGGALMIYSVNGNRSAVTIVNGVFSNNTTNNIAYGGGIVNWANFSSSASLTLINSTISDNSVSGGSIGGGIYNYGSNSSYAPLTIENSTIADNSAYQGGGIYSYSSGGSTVPLIINNSTIANNSAQSYGGGIVNYGSGGAVVAIISNSTIVGNTGTGFSNGIRDYYSTTIISDSILSGNLSNGTEADYSSNSGTLISTGYNLYGQNGDAGGFTGNGTTDIQLNGALSTVLQTDVNGAPLLANNGGPTQTIALVIGSAAYLAGGPVGSVTTDQRGEARGSIISIGAWDYDPAQLSLLVNTTSDATGDAIGGATTSLRDAIFYGKVGGFIDPTVTFDASVFTGGATNTITLAQGQLVINSSLNIDASAVGNVTIDANQLSRVMEIDGNTTGITVNLNNLTLTHGYITTRGGGLLIYTEGNKYADVTIRNSTISDNSTTQQGGGIYNDGYDNGHATLTIINSTITGNSTINDDPNYGDGGGIANDGVDGHGTVTIVNSTISGNSAIIGGGIYNAGLHGNAAMTITNSTITGNSATTAGGIYNNGMFGNALLTIGNTILAGNTDSNGESDFAHYAGTVTNNGYNLYGQNANDGGFTGNGTTDRLLTNSISSVLTPLGNYGGPTQTMALIVGSAAYLKGGPLGSVTTDQRGETRGSIISIGAWDYDPSQLSLVVNTKADTANDIIGSTPVTLRDASFYGEVGGFADPTVTFDPSVFTGGAANTITLAQGQLLITGSVNIDASAVGNVTIDANHASRVMEIDGNNAGITVNLNNLALINGNGTAGNTAGGRGHDGTGGGLLINGENDRPATVTITDSTISGNSASNFGGGIFNSAEVGITTLTINNSTISGNSAAYSGNSSGGGAIFNDGAAGGSATLTINNSTISGNSALGTNVGGIVNKGGSGSATLTINNSTISGNSSGVGGVGGILNYGVSGTATVTIGNTILAGNTLPGGGEADYSSTSGIFHSTGYNLYGQSGNSGGFTGNGTTDILLGGSISTVLGSLANNGGPTQTMALVLGSAAIDAGNPTQIGQTDQRGVVRGDGGFTGSASDIGAYEAQIIDVTAQNQSYTYGGTLPTLTYTVTNGDASGLLIGSLALITAETNAGFYAGDIGQGTLASSSPYLISFTAGDLTINQATLIVSVNGGGTSQYGLTPTNPGISLTGGTLYHGDTLNSLGLGDDFALTSASNAGVYTIKVTGASAVSNYEVTTNSATYEITKATLNVAVNSGGTSQYGLAPTNPGVGVTGGTLYNGDTLSGLGIGDDFSLTSSSNAGSYTIHVTGYTGLTNYTVTPSSADYMISKAALNVAVNSGGTSQYGLTPTDPGIGVTGGTLYNGDTLSGLGIGDDFSLTSSNNAGTYTIHVTGYTGLTNYTVTPSSADYIITKAALNVAVNSGGTSVYGSTPNDPGISLTGGTLYNGDTLSGLDIADDFNLTAESNVGTYPISVTGSTGLTNYTVTPTSANYVVTPATLTYVANPVFINLSQPLPPLKGTVTGFVNDDNLANATTGTLIFTTPAVGSSPAGSYAINGSGLAANHGNYVFVQDPDNATALTIGGYLFGQPFNPLQAFSAQFNANANYNTFFTQGWFPLFDPQANGWLLPVFAPGNVPHPVYSKHEPGYDPNKKPPGGVISFGSSYLFLGQNGGGH